MHGSCWLYPRRESLRAAAFCILPILASGSIAHAQLPNAAQRAVEEAKNIPEQRSPWNGRLACRALDPLNFSGPLWESLTGIKIKVVEVPLPEVFSKIMLEYRSGNRQFRRRRRGSFVDAGSGPGWRAGAAGSIYRQIRLSR